MSRSRKPSFHCPVSPHIAWSWGLIFKECPVAASERDMDECRSCPLRGAAVPKDRSKPKRDVSDRHKRSPGKTSDGVTPKKGDTFVG